MNDNYNEYYIRFKEELEKRRSEFPKNFKSNKHSKGRYYLSFSSHYNKYYVEYTSRGYGDKDNIGFIVGIYLNCVNYKDILSELQSKSDLPKDLIFLDTAKVGRIFYRKNGDITNKNNWDEYITWQINKLKELIIIIKPQQLEKCANANANMNSNNKGSNTNQTQPLNQILFGPPGTGKTYSTINKALEIIDGVVPNDRTKAKAKFEEYKKAGQIEFVTFHQSYGYEEFVEGIKAKTTDKGIEYQIEDGIFKCFVKKAQNKEIFSIGQTIGKYRIVSLTNELMKLKRENGSLIPIPMYLLNEVLDLIDKETISMDDIYNKVAMNEKMSIESEKYIINGYHNVFRDLALFHIENRKLKNNINQNHILIIDEINRGNISKIFGELITLIEPSKRIGADEEIKVKLPYSNDDFGVPQNLYIIGTMNTADRSIALMDTALRRRFEFVEMLPKPELLDFEVEGINIKSMLEKINKRVEYLYDRDHTIGHTYFINLLKESSKDKQKIELDSIFKNKIIPLLSEYFYDDWEKILMVLGDGFIQKEIIKDDIFDYKVDDYLEDEKSIYTIKNKFDFSSFR